MTVFTATMSELKGKVAFVTGVSTGIGEAISMELVKHGMIVSTSTYMHFNHFQGSVKYR